MLVLREELEPLARLIAAGRYRRPARQHVAPGRCRAGGRIMGRQALKKSGLIRSSPANRGFFVVRVANAASQAARLGATPSAANRLRRLLHTRWGNATLPI